jgi:exonuclease III
MRTGIVPAVALAWAASPFSVAEQVTHSVPAPQAARIIVDGAFEDWQGIQPAYEDLPGSTPDGGIDLGRLWITNDEHYLFLRLEVGAEILVQEDNRLTLYIDSDDDPTTGLAVRGIGAEVRWMFGGREGVFVDGARSMSVSANRIGLITAPTVTSSEFEIALDRRAQVEFGGAIFPGKTIRIVLSDNDEARRGRGRGDVLPDSMSGVRYTFDDTVLPPLPVLSLAKRSPSHLRVLSYNTNNRVATRSRADAYQRILKAIGPDVLVLQEVRRNSAEEVHRYLQQLYPPLTRGEWYTAQAGEEASVVISPFPITSSHPLGQSAAFVLDLRASWGTDLLLVSLSPPCCGRNRRRQREIDLIMAFVRDAKSGSGAVHLASETPIALVGDANLVGHAQQRITLLAGDIVNVNQFGPTFTTDWDGTPFADLLPRHTHRPVTFTWYGEEYSAGRLDYVVYSDAVMEVGNRFVLFTPEMPDSALARYGLRRDDTLVVSDHLPVVADFAPRPGRR